jgi:hypothetical protein
MEKMEMQDLNRKKQRLRLTLLAAATLGCSSVTLSGALAALGGLPAPHALAPAATA